MTLKTLVTGVAAAAVVGGAALGVTSIASGSLSAAPAVQPVVFDIPLPLDTPCGATEDQLRGVLDSLAAPGGSFSSSKSGLVQGGVGIIEGKTADRLLRNAYQEGSLPVAFDIAPPICGPGGTSATALVSAAGRSQNVTFVNEAGVWKLSRGSATTVLSAFS